jgi:hypothetical protein
MHTRLTLDTCTQIPVIKPRSYSIASSPLMHPDVIELCVVSYMRMCVYVCIYRYMHTYLHTLHPPPLCTLMSLSCVW